MRQFPSGLYPFWDHRLVSSVETGTVQSLARELGYRGGYVRNTAFGLFLSGFKYEIKTSHTNKQRNQLYFYKKNQIVKRKHNKCIPIFSKRYYCVNMFKCKIIYKNKKGAVAPLNLKMCFQPVYLTSTFTTPDFPPARSWMT